MKLDENIANYYNKGKEKSRLENGLSQLEKIRTLDILERNLPEEELTIIDIGGGAGVYSFHLSNQGHKVHLVDIVPLHIEQAKEINKNSINPLVSIQAGDVRELPYEDNFADVILLFGPLYHLTDEKERIKALEECYRVLKPEGVIFSSAISKFASLLDGFQNKFILDQKFRKILDQDLKSGQHRNPDNIDHYFTTAYFHDPNKFLIEHIEAGFENLELLSIEGPLGLICSIEDFLKSEEQKKIYLEYSKKIEKEINLIGASSHLMVIGRKQSV